MDFSFSANSEISLEPRLGNMSMSVLILVRFVRWLWVLLVCFEFLISSVIEKEHSPEQFLIISVRENFKAFSELRQVTLTLLSI